MAKPLHQLPPHNGAGIILREPLSHTLGICECGCGDTISGDYEYIAWSNMYFSDRGHLIKYLKLTDDLKEVG